jgi:plasmid maintenance system antidote protein VapI
MELVMCLYLKEWLEKQQISIATFARKLNISRTYMSLIVNGKRRPTPELAIKIEKETFGEVTKEYLVFGLSLKISKDATAHAEP